MIDLDDFDVPLFGGEGWSRRRRRHHQIAASKKVEIVKRLRSGETLVNIASELGVSTRTVNELAKKYGIHNPINRNRGDIARAKTLELRTAALSLRRQGKTFKEIGKLLDVRLETARKWALSEARREGSRVNTFQCQAEIEDYANGDRYNLICVIIVPKRRQCSFKATQKLGPLCLCKKHCELAREGLVDEKGKVAGRSEIRDVRKYPRNFPSGLFQWAKDLKSEAL